MFTDRVNLAIVLAASVYCDKTRKGTNIPYIAHPVAVGMIIRDYTDEETAIIAGILQGVLELAHPAFYSEADMRRDFGDVITDIVKDVSEPKTTEQSKLPWKERNQSYLKRLSNFHYPEAYIVATANEIHYLTELLNTYLGLVVKFGIVSMIQSMIYYNTIVMFLILSKLNRYRRILSANLKVL